MIAVVRATAATMSMFITCFDFAHLANNISAMKTRKTKPQPSCASSKRLKRSVPQPRPRRKQNAQQKRRNNVKLMLHEAILYSTPKTLP